MQSPDQSKSHRQHLSKSIQLNQVYKPSQIASKHKIVTEQLKKMKSNAKVAFNIGRIVPKHMVYDQEYLYGENLRSRQDLKNLQIQNMKLKTRIALMQKQQEQIINQLLPSNYEQNKGSSKSLVLRASKKNPVMLQNMSKLRKILRQTRDECDRLHKQNNNLKKTVKYTQIQEINIERDYYQKQCQRLMNKISPQKQLLQNNSSTVNPKILQKLKNDYKVSKQAQNNLQNLLNKANKQIQSLKTQKNSLSGQITKLKKQCNRLRLVNNKKLSNSPEKQSYKKCQKCQTLQKQLLLQQQKLVKQQQQLSNKQTQISNLQVDLKKTEQQVQQLKNKLIKEKQLNNIAKQTKQIKQTQTTIETKQQATMTIEEIAIQKIDTQEKDKSQIKIDQSYCVQNQELQKYHTENIDRSSKILEDTSIKKPNQQLQKQTTKQVQKQADKQTQKQLDKNTSQQKDVQGYKSIIAQQQKYVLSKTLSYRFYAQLYTIQDIQQDLRENQIQRISVNQLIMLFTNQPFLLNQQLTQDLLAYLFGRQNIAQQDQIASNQFINRISKLVESYQFMQEKLHQEYLGQIRKYFQSSDSAQVKGQVRKASLQKVISQKKLKSILKKQTKFNEHQILLCIAETALFSEDSQQLRFVQFTQGKRYQRN